MTTAGSGSYSRFHAIREATSRRPRKFERVKDDHDTPLKVSEYFGINTFDLRRMREKLPKEIFQKLQSTTIHGKRLDLDVANAVASAVKEWATSKGVTHYCHWFQPQTGGTAEKHDAFLDFQDGKTPIEKFSGHQLIQSEPDASSFPSGGVRTTFEARGYTAWDPTSPMFIMEHTNGSTLCVPSAFIGYHGQALDQKTVLLRSMEALSDRAVGLLKVLGFGDAQRVVPTLGAEQEYFLVDRAFFALRPDLVMSGRTLCGAQPHRGQQMEDHYFGSIPSRVQAFMAETEHELYKLGVPVKTRHNEVAPSQFEAAAIFDEANVAVDHNQLIMEVMKKVARRHNYEVLFHEKPFAELNGSGKHNNWAMMIAGSGDKLDGANLLDPGTTPQHNLRFLLFLMATMKGVHKHSGLLRSGIASSGNDHRLGANEAPPAILSVFLGETLNKILDHIESGVSTDDDAAEDAVLKLGVSKLPEVLQDNTDRNRTSPFAFTGNKFEFRAVGSSMSPAIPMTLLNSVVADGIEEVTALLEKKLGEGASIEAAGLSVLKEVITETKAVRFEGNNYSDEWVKEAQKRGLLNLRRTPESLAQMITPSSQKLLTRLKVFSEEELRSRYNVRLERYSKTMFIESETLVAMIDTYILPAVYAYHGDLAENVASAKAAGVAGPQEESLKVISQLVSKLQTRRAELGVVLTKAHGMDGDEPKQADLLASKVAEAMESAREVCDELEDLVADHIWPLPKYREMLFLSS